MKIGLTVALAVTALLLIGYLPGLVLALVLAGLGYATYLERKDRRRCMAA
ncbi:hypothetical protein ACIP5Y_02830 [Nocardia sp. NPDC088792]